MRCGGAVDIIRNGGQGATRFQSGAEQIGAPAQLATRRIATMVRPEWSVAGNLTRLPPQRSSAAVNELATFVP